MATLDIQNQRNKKMFWLICWILGTFALMFGIGFIGYQAGWGERNLTFATASMTDVFNQAFGSSAIIVIITLFFYFYARFLIWIFRSYRSARVLGYGTVALFYLFFLFLTVGSITSPSQINSYDGLVFMIIAFYMLFAVPVAVFIGWLFGLFFNRLR
jgi:heme A synthase